MIRDDPRDRHVQQHRHLLNESHYTNRLATRQLPSESKAGTLAETSRPGPVTHST